MEPTPRPVDTPRGQPAMPPAAYSPTEGPAARAGLAERISWGAILVMVFLVPIVMSDFTLPGLGTRLDFSSLMLVKLALMRVLLLMSLGAWTWGILRNGGRMRRTPVDWLIAGFLVWITITTFTSVHWPTALFGTYRRYEGLLTFVTYALAYFLVLQLAHTPSRVRHLGQTLFLTSVVVAVYGLLQYAGVVFVPQELDWQNTKRAFSTYGNPMILGGFLIFSLTVALGLALEERRLARRFIYWVGFGLSGLALIVTFTRGAWVGAVVSVLILGVMIWRQRVTFRRMDWIPAGAVVLATVGLVWRSVASNNAITNVVERLTSVFQFGSGSGQTRTEIWQAALSAIKERPIFGWGADTFGYTFSRFKPLEYLRDAGANSSADNAHNYALHLASGIGILGLLLFCGICIWAGVRSFRTVFGRSKGSGGIILGAFWAASAGYLANLLTGISVSGATLFLWAALALVLAPTARIVEVKACRWGTVIAIVVLVAAGSAIAGQGVVMAADTAFWDSTEELSRTPDDRAAAALRAVDLNPWEPAHRSALAAAYRDLMSADMSAVFKAQAAGDDPASSIEAFERSFAKTEAAYKDAIDFTPDDYANYVNLAAVYNAAAQVLGEHLYPQAIETVQRGLEVMPLGTAIRVQLARALFATGKESEAVETLEYCIQLDQRDGSAALALADIYVQQDRTDEALALLKSVEALAPGQAGVANTIKELERNPSSE